MAARRNVQIALSKMRATSGLGYCKGVRECVELLTVGPLRDTRTLNAPAYHQSHPLNINHGAQRPSRDAAPGSIPREGGAQMRSYLID